MNTSSRLSFNPITPRRALFYHRPDERRNRNQLDLAAMHVREQHLPNVVDVIDLPEVYDRFSACRGGRRRLPALAKFGYPRSREFSLEAKAKLLGAIQYRNFEHGRIE
jgi:hypothetical protein